VRGDMSDARWQLEPLARSVPEARRCVRMTLSEWGLDAILDTVVLLTSEVVTNAVLHARTPVGVVVRRLNKGVSVEVSDGSRRQPKARLATADATTGRGLALLDQLASTWEVALHANGKTVRFTVTGDRDPWAAFSVDSWAVDQ